MRSDCKVTPMPPVEDLLKVLRLDPTSPSGLRFVQSGKGRPKSLVVGHSCARGYWRTVLFGSSFLCHRLVYFLTHGVDPKGTDLDHADGNPANNDPGNIRPATVAQNGANAKPQRGSTSPFKGVSWGARDRKWRAGLTKDGVHTSLGSYHSEKEAALAVNREAIRVHGEFAWINDLDNPGQRLEATA